MYSLVRIQHGRPTLMELQKIVLQPWLMPTDYSQYCGMYRYNKKIREVVFPPVWYCSYLRRKTIFINSNGEYENAYCFWVFGSDFRFPIKSTNLGQFFRKLQDRGIENKIHSYIISNLISERIIQP